jgi:CubicO group peptidase (beta-lactamase class C family)
MLLPLTNPSFGKPLARATPEAAGVRSEDVAAFVAAAKARKINLHSFLLLRGDKVYAEGYYAPYGPDQLQTVYSLSKSFTSVAVGIACFEGILDLDERIVDIFADEIEGDIGKELAALTLRDCLRMSTGQPKEIPGPDMVKAFLSMPFTDMPGEHFRYNTMATYMLSAALKKRKVDLEEYLQEKLFDPMGIHGLRWMRCGRGIPTGGYGLSLLPEVIAKFGILLKNDGVWEGRRLIPHEYLALATSKQIDNREGNAGEWTYGYGYQFWMCRYDTFRGDGAFGQLCVVSKKQDAVLAVTAFTDDMQAELDLYFEHILCRMADGPLPENPEALKRLLAQLEECNCPIQPVPDDGQPFPEALLGRTLKDETGITLRFDRVADGLRFTADAAGAFLLARGGFRDQIARCVSSPLGYPQAEMESRALAGWGVRADGTVCVRIVMLELLNDWLIELTPEDGGWKLRVTDVHLPGKPQTIFVGMARWGAGWRHGSGRT